MSKHLRTRVDWPTLRDWCLAHGAKNDSIVSIQIDGRGNDFNVILTGNERNAEGRHFLESRHDVATWRTVQTLRFLP